ncbi:BolA family transcriptional regulator [Neisseria sp. ZJ106]|uniref:BolA family transcriptional regulator n=1 Tax=Neisseria lisongii TaxID=2912188 RepID=A0AAW5ABR6_9NEIS|nr:BolA family protein [Neisseria lisongii]MCF7521907.1 BolA family transcriptional regulator [Neisseria lisongii]MCF7529096.1 BolA family transcriptional regulator [Neisseria lisongii]WCL71130.1 BolA family transcriptional regulator [Neisseria lisongii]
MSDMRQAIEGRLKSLNLTAFAFTDESHLHIGHAGNKGGGHYAVLAVSPEFAGVSRLNRQRMIKNLLQDLFSDGLIHALSIKAQTPEEYAQS